ncbi:hypothetical protein X943_000731 [Babesia divergens]|uniref:Uncharacterized protein n=1 Tax=Babesia divergens TaxID=32595 RepID=A0AAD9G6N5_BABDI|nr:hypothetical protein X943_000731 [Babesia divergens]
MFQPAEPNPRHSLHRTEGKALLREEVPLYLRPQEHSDNRQQDVNRYSHRMGATRPLPRVDIMEHYPQQPIHRALQNSERRTRSGCRNEFDAPRSVKLSPSQIRREMKSHPVNNYEQAFEANPNMIMARTRPNQIYERQRLTRADLNRLEADNSDVDDLMLLNDETKELRRQLSFAKREYREMKTSNLESQLNPNGMHNCAAAMTGQRRREKSPKPSLPRHSQEPWKEAVGDLCSGVGCMVLTMCKVVSFTGKTALSACTQFSAATDTACKASDPGIRHRTSYGRHYEDGQRQIRPHIGFNTHRQSHERYNQTVVNRDRGMRHSKYEEHRVGHHEPKMWNDINTRGSKYTKDLSPKITRARSHLAIDSEIDSVSSDGSSYGYNDRSGSTGTRSSPTPSDSESSFEIRECHDSYDIGLGYYSRPDIPHLSQRYPGVSNDRFAASQSKPPMCYDRNDNSYPIGVAYGGHKGNSRQSKVVHIDMGELDASPPDVPRVSQAPELQPRTTGPAPKSYGHADLSVSESRTYALMSRCANSSTLPLTNVVAPITPVNAGMQPPISQAAHQILVDVTGRTIGHSMIAADKNVADRIIKHQPARNGDDAAALPETATAHSNSSEAHLDKNDSICDINGDDCREDRVVPTDEEQTTSKEESKQKAKRKSFSFGTMWKPAKQETPKLNVPLT